MPSPFTPGGGRGEVTWDTCSLLTEPAEDLVGAGAVQGDRNGLKGACAKLTRFPSDLSAFVEVVTRVGRAAEVEVEINSLLAKAAKDLVDHRDGPRSTSGGVSVERRDLVTRTIGRLGKRPQCGACVDHRHTIEVVDGGLDFDFEVDITRGPTNELGALEGDVRVLPLAALGKAVCGGERSF